MPRRKPGVRSSPDRSFARTSPSILSASSHSGPLESMRSLPASYGMATLHARFVHDTWNADERGPQDRSAVGAIRWVVLTSQVRGGGQDPPGGSRLVVRGRKEPEPG